MTLLPVRHVRLLVALSLPLIEVVALGTPLKLDYRGGPSTLKLPGLPDMEIPHRHTTSVPYKVGPANWLVWLDPDKAEDPQGPEYLRGPDAVINKVLQTELPKQAGWNLKTSESALADDSLIVHLYEAAHQEHCAGKPDAGACAGANFAVEYKQLGENPKDIHWMQIIVTNHPDGAGHPKEDKASRYLDKKKDVYYDNGATASSTLFFDGPRREDDQPHFWEGYLFVVTGPAIGDGKAVPPGEITFWGGVKWGWNNACVDPQKRLAAPGAAQPAACCACAEVPEPSTLSMVSLTAVGFGVLIMGRTLKQCAISSEA